MAGADDAVAQLQALQAEGLQQGIAGGGGKRLLGLCLHGNSLLFRDLARPCACVSMPAACLPGSLTGQVDANAASRELMAELDGGRRI